MYRNVFPKGKAKKGVVSEFKSLMTLRTPRQEGLSHREYLLLI